MTEPATPELTLRVFDSRRQIGPNLLHDGPGAALEFVWGEDRSAQPGGSFTVAGSADLAAIDALLAELIERWRHWARAALDGLGWQAEQLFVRRFAGHNQSGGPLRGATLALSAPLDGLWTATEINEWAIKAAVTAAAVTATSAAAAPAQGEQPDLEAALTTLRASRDKEARRREHLAALAQEAERRGVTLLADDRRVSLGTGASARVLELRSLPAPASVDWSELRDIPAVFVTGTNGKSTTVRLLHAIGQAAGLCTGLTSTDWIRVGDEIVERGDCAGPDGARTLLRDPRVELAICETARGGILRRGLPLRRADAAIVTNVAEDHLGQWGVLDLAGMVETKLVVGRLVSEGGRTGRAPLILNADDASLLAYGPSHRGPIAWFSLRADQQGLPAEVREHLARGGTAALLERSQRGGEELLVLRHGARRTEIAAAAELPVTLGGAARHNVANALAAILAADAVGLPTAALRAGLLAFRPDAEANPGRGNRYELGGVLAVADFAHNVHGMAALADMLAALPAQRRLLILGQAGDRSDAAIAALVRAAWRCGPQRVIIKEQEPDLRGRALGEVPAVIAAELLRLGAPPESLSHAPSELAAVYEALEWARPGDLLALFLHSQREECLALLDQLRAANWQPGQPLP
ncbi:MAG: Mur ligase family protein [Planctomycetota bacterium]